MKDPTKRFTGLAEVYASARPTYPLDAIEYIIKTAQLSPGDSIADIGAGTGISSRLFAKSGFNVIAVEPNLDMRAQASAEGTEYGACKITYVDGTGEASGLADDSQDLVLSAQAFHWLRAEEALIEFKRILKPGRWVALLWNERDESDPLTAEYGDALRIGPDTAAVEMKRFVAGVPLLESALFCAAHKSVFANEQELDLDGLIRRAFSASYTPKEEPLAGQVRQKLIAAFERFQSGGKVRMRYVTGVFMAQKTTS
jgi:SAM-dependent methyltransferase